MADIRVGRAVFRKSLSPILQILRVVPENGTAFPEYRAGQYIALRRANCRLTKRIAKPDGSIDYQPDVDDSGNQRRGTVTHSYSISSAPFETARYHFLEFYVILELHETGEPGRLTESLFQIDPNNDNKLEYFNKIAGDFTLESRASGFKNVVLVGTGTGLAPFASMIKQLSFQAENGGASDVRYTLFHANRGFHELGYHDVLLEVQAAKKFDFVYVPSVSRPSKQDFENRSLGTGRANNVLRAVLGMPLKEEQDLELLQSQGQDLTHAKALLERAVKPTLPRNLSREELLTRMEPGKTVLLCCGNPRTMDDINYIATANKIQFEKEEW